MMNEQLELGEQNQLLDQSSAGIRGGAGLTASQLYARLRSTTGCVQNGYVVQTFTRGTGPAKTTFWTGYWSAAGS
jgi:hypothetical protein